MASIDITQLPSVREAREKVRAALRERGYKPRVYTNYSKDFELEHPDFGEKTAPVRPVTTFTHEDWPSNDEFEKTEDGRYRDSNTLLGLLRQGVERVRPTSGSSSGGKEDGDGGEGGSTGEGEQGSEEGGDGGGGDSGREEDEETQKAEEGETDEYGSEEETCHSSEEEAGREVLLERQGEVREPEKKREREEKCSEPCDQASSKRARSEGDDPSG